MIKFFKFSALQYIAIFISIGVNFFLAKYLSKDNYGIYSLGLVYYNIIYGITDFGLERNGLVKLNNSKFNFFLEEVYSQVLVRVATIVLVTFISLFYAVTQKNFNIICWYIVAGFIHSTLPKYFFDYKYKFIQESFILILDRLAFVSLIVLSFYGNNLTNFTIAIAYTVGRFLYVVMSSFALWKNPKRQIKWEEVLKKTRYTFKNNFVFWLSTTSNVFLLFFNQLLLGTKTGYGALAVFAFAMQFVSMLRIIQTQFLRWNTPKISELISSNKMSFRRLNSFLFRSFLFSFFSSLLLFIAASLIIEKFYPNFSESVPVLIVLCIWSVFYGPGIINSFILSNKISGNIFLLISILTTSCSVILGYVFKADAFKMAVAISVSHTTAMFIQYYLSFKNYDKS